MSVWCHIEGSDLTASQVLPMHSGAAGTSANSVKQCLWQVSRSHCLDIATAERDGDDYILNGRKVYIGNSHVGDLHSVVVRTGIESKGQALIGHHGPVRHCCWRTEPVLPRASLVRECGRRCS